MMAKTYALNRVKKDVGSTSDKVTNRWKMLTAPTLARHDF